MTRATLTRAMGLALGTALLFSGAAGDAFAGSSKGRYGPPKPLFKCTTLKLPGPYILKRNIKAKGDCFVIKSNYVTLNLGGHVIKGDGSGRAVTDNGDGLRGTQVANGSITNFALAVDLNASPTSAVENLRIVANSAADSALDCNTGPLVAGFPSGITTGSSSIVEGNLLLDNKGLAIKVGSGSLVENNVIQNTQSIGLDDDEAFEVTGICAFSGSRVSDNAITDNDGLAVQANSGSALARNTVRDNGNGLRSNSASSLNGNTTHRNDGFGIQANCPSSLIGNAAVENGEVNIATQGDGCLLVDNLSP